MKKRFMKVALFGALTLAAGASFVGCKDYDDDISGLQEQITANKTAIEKLQSLIGEGKFITGVTKTGDGLVFTVSNGGASITIPSVDGKDGSVVEIGANGNWVIDGVDTGKPSKGADGITGPAGPAGPGGAEGAYYVPNADGYWHKITGTTDTKTDQKWLPEGTLTATSDGNFVTLFNIAGYPNGLKLSMNANFVASLSYIPTNIDTQLGETAFFPVIGTDDDSKGAEGKFEYNLSSKKYATTIINGWCDFAFKVNPANVAKTNFEAVRLVADSAYTAAAFSDADMTRAESVTNFPTLKESSKKDFGYVKNVMNVKASAQGYRMVNTGNEFDDPNGMEATPEFAGTIGNSDVTFVNTVALQVKNVNANDPTGDNGIVTSKYVNAKRMVVPQEFVEIGLNKTEKMDKSLPLTEFRKLSDMYAKSSTKEEVQIYLADAAIVPVSLQVPFSGKTSLSTLIEGYATKFATNTGFAAETSQYLLTRLGFDAPTYKYSVESYKLAEVDQTTRYLQLAENGDITFDQANTAAIEREPVIKVQMYIGETLVMTKLLKIKVMKVLQVEEKFPVNDLTDIVLGCEDNAQSIDFDQVFNHCGFGKAQFVEAYSANGENKYEVLKANAAGKYELYLDSDIKIKGTDSDKDILGTALSKNNTITVITEPTVKPGSYRIQMIFKANATSVKYSPLVVTDDFKVAQPTITANINTVYWKDGHAQFNVQAPKSDYVASECIFDVDLNTYFVIDADGKAVLKYSDQPTTGDYSCAIADFIFDGSTIVDAKGDVATGVVIAAGGKKISIGPNVVGTIDGTADHLALTNSEATQKLLNTGKFTIKDVKLQVTLRNGTVSVKKFNIDVIRPLALDSKASGAFTDAANLGSDLSFDEIIAMKDWRGKKVSLPGSTNDAEKLGTFYAVETWATTLPFEATVVNGVYVLDVTKIKTNLKEDASGNWAPDASVTEANAKVTLPATTILAVKTTGSGITEKYFLNYKTNMGTITKAYKMWIPVAVGYKWGKVMGSVEVTVNPANPVTP